MTRENKTLFLAQGILCIEKAQGYWFTSGGGKSSFGYYPHLKTKIEINGKSQLVPVFPDTQIHGDLKMAAEWLNRLNNRRHDDFITEIFGKSDGSGPAKLKITDMKLAEPEKWTKDRFDVKTRSRINDDTRTNETHMLADMEWAFLEGLGLEATLYLGYFNDEDLLKTAMAFISDSLDLLIGFGASRSRGAGRGRMEIKWEKPQRLAYCLSDAGVTAASEYLHYVLTPLVPFRNKQLTPGASQLLRSQTAISGGQIKSWFANAFYQLFGDWPTPEQMALISLSTAYPALKAGEEVFLPAYPPPGSTIALDDGRMEDMYNKPRKRDEKMDQENYVRSKAKPLGDDWFLTNAAKPAAFQITGERRMRNSTEGHDNFTTKDGGLFVQELIHPCRPYLSVLRIRHTGNPDFCAKARFVFSNLWPDIGGAFFTPQLKPCRDPENVADGVKPKHRMVAEPLEFKPEWMDQAECQVRVGMVRRYNTSLKRPRRNRIVFLPGAIINPVDDPRVLNWKGFGADIDKKPPMKPDKCETSLPRKMPAGISGMSPSQTGNLRAMLLMHKNAALTKIDETLKKYASWDREKIASHLIPKEILETLKGHLENNRKDLFEKEIHAICAAAARSKWEKDKAMIHEKLIKAKEAHQMEFKKKKAPREVTP